MPTLDKWCQLRVACTALQLYLSRPGVGDKLQKANSMASSVWANPVALPGFVRVQLLWSMERLCQESSLCEVLGWNLLKLTNLCLFLYHLKSKQFSAFYAPGAASSCVEIIHENPTSLCRNRDLLPALLTLHMFYLSSYLFICHFWIGCFAMCSFSTMIQIYSDSRDSFGETAQLGSWLFQGQSLWAV